MSTSGLLLHFASTIKIQLNLYVYYKTNTIIISHQKVIGFYHDIAIAETLLTWH